MTRIAVVIPSWNTCELLAKCLAALANSSAALEIVVIDNASNDGSAELVERAYPNVKLVRNAQNVGFAKAINQGIQATSAALIFCLNSDTEVAPDAIERLAHFLESSGSYAAAAPRLLNLDGSTQRACMNFPRWSTALWYGTPLERWFPHSAELERYFARSFTHEHDGDVLQPPAAALLVRRCALDQVGVLDEALPLFFNDVDLSKRLDAAGWRTRFLQAAHVQHVGGASARQLATRLERWHLDRLHYYRKHHGRLAGLWIKACTGFAWIDFAITQLFWRMHPRRAGAAEALGPTTRAFARFLLS